MGKRPEAASVRRPALAGQALEGAGPKGPAVRCRAVPKALGTALEDGAVSEPRKGPTPIPSAGGGGGTPKK